jgi:hypothetical protein
MRPPYSSAGIVIRSSLSEGAMPTRELLPGVTVDSVPPAVVCDAHAALRKARRRAYVRDAITLSLLIAADALFIHWPESRLPFADRGQSLTLLWAMNALLLADLWLTRAIPRWWARRIASTWCRSEREKFQRQRPS